MFLLPVKFLLKQLKKAGSNGQRNIYELRKQHDNFLSKRKYAKNVKWHDEKTPFGKWRIFTPDNLKYNTVILHFHGGTLCMGGISSHSPFVSYLADKTQCRIILAEYRLAPEHPYPASFDDALNFYKYLITETEFKNNDIAISADSGGGLLAFSIVQQCHKLLLKTPKVLLLFAPASNAEILDAPDLYQDLNERDSVLDIEQIKRFCKGIFGDHEVDDPIISPIYADYTAFPPFFSVIGSEELLLDSLRMVHMKAFKAGVDCKLLVQQNCFHGHYMFPDLFKEAEKAISEASAFLHKRIK